MATQYVNDDDLLRLGVLRVKHEISLIPPGSKEQPPRLLAQLRPGGNVIARNEADNKLFVYCPDAGEPAVPSALRRCVRGAILANERTCQKA
jgi:hypothetical protein